MAQRITLNTPITFGRQGTIRQFEPFGFDVSETGQSWSIDEMAGFTAELGGVSPETPVSIRVTASAYVLQGRIAAQQLFVYSNGLFVGFRNVSAAGDLEFMLPRESDSPRICHVTFVIPTAVAPKTLGVGSDVRKLGIAVSKVTFVEKRSA